MTSLAELSERLTLQFSAKFGPGTVKIVSDTEQAEKGDRDEGGWVLVTHVTPYWEPAELAHRPSLFERTHHNVRHFMFDTPFTRDGPAQGGPAQQWKRRTILTSKKLPAKLFLPNIINFLDRQLFWSTFLQKSLFIILNLYKIINYLHRNYKFENICCKTELRQNFTFFVK